jgi:hypothetical protein
LLVQKLNWLHKEKKSTGDGSRAVKAAVGWQVVPVVMGATDRRGMGRQKPICPGSWNIGDLRTHNN